jgi:cell division topological specificity factor
MTKFFERLLNRDTRSANQAKERMKLVLIHDRTDLKPGSLEKLKDELIDVISRYVEIDAEEIQIQIAQEGRQQRLIAEIPLMNVRRRRVG